MPSCFAEVRRIEIFAQHRIVPLGIDLIDRHQRVLDPHVMHGEMIDPFSHHDRAQLRDHLGDTRILHERRKTHWRSISDGKAARPS